MRRQPLTSDDALDSMWIGRIVFGVLKPQAKQYLIVRLARPRVGLADEADVMGIAGKDENAGRRQYFCFFVGRGDNPLPGPIQRECRAVFTAPNLPDFSVHPDVYAQAR